MFGKVHCKHFWGIQNINSSKARVWIAFCLNFKYFQAVLRLFKQYLCFCEDSCKGNVPAYLGHSNMTHVTINQLGSFHGSNALANSPTQRLSAVRRESGKQTRRGCGTLLNPSTATHFLSLSTVKPSQTYSRLEICPTNVIVSAQRQAGPEQQ